MENKKILAEAYVNAQYIDYGDLNESAEKQIKESFIEGFNSGKKLKWNNVISKLPKSDHDCLCWVKNEHTLHFSTFKIGSCINNNWYLQEGRESHERVIHWIKIERPK